MAVKVHLDTDIGGDLDDLCALAMLLRWPGVEITGITTVADEAGRRAGYAAYVLGLAGRTEIPVAAGADVSLGRFRSRPGYPPEDEYWPEPIRRAPGPLEAALELLRQSVEQQALIIAIGPFTNLSLLDARYPGILGQSQVYLMGGAVHPPRPDFPPWGVEMDYNCQLDVSAARHVMETYRTTLVPLEVTVQTALRRSYLPAVERAGPLGHLIARQARVFARDERNEERYGQTCPGLPDDTINFQHDPLACAAALGWSGVKIEERPLVFEIRDGWLSQRIDPAGRLRPVVTAVDGPRFDDLWFQVVTGTGPAGE